MFRSVLARGERLGAGPVLRRRRGLLIFLSRRFRTESLYRCNAEFGPRRACRFVVFRTGRALPRIGFAAMRTEGFVHLSAPRPFRVPHPRPCGHRQERGTDQHEVRAA